MTYKAFFDKKRKFGIEVEMFAVDRYELLHTLTENGCKAKIALYEDPNVDYWTLTEDSTIQGEDSLELKSPILQGGEGLLEVKKVLTLLQYLECQVNDSCGLHVHWGVQDYTGRNILALLRLYAKFENVIDGLVAVSRRENKNIHCRSLASGDEDLAWITALDESGNTRALDVALGYRNLFRTRLSKINVLSYLKFGTVEFRQHESTLDIDEAVNWIVFTQLLVNKAKQSSVSKEMSAKPMLGEMLRILGLVEHQNPADPLALTCRDWLKAKFAPVRGRRKELATA